MRAGRPPDAAAHGAPSCAPLIGILPGPGSRAGPTMTMSPAGADRRAWPDHRYNGPAPAGHPGSLRAAIKIQKTGLQPIVTISRAAIFGACYYTSARFGRSVQKSNFVRHFKAPGRLRARITAAVTRRCEQLFTLNPRYSVGATSTSCSRQSTAHVNFIKFVRVRNLPVGRAGRRAKPPGIATISVQGPGISLR